MSIDISSVFSNNMDKIKDYGNDLQAQMTKTMESGEMDPTAMLDLQFKMGQYNAMIEATSTITKSVLDTTKSVIQRTG